MNTSGLYVVLLFSQTVLGAEPMIPTPTPPIVYTINYSGEFFKKPEYIEQFKAAPPDLLHMGKAVPIVHSWGPIRLYEGENQRTGGPGHTLSWENIALLSPEALAERTENIRRRSSDTTRSAFARSSHTSATLRWPAITRSGSASGSSTTIGTSTLGGPDRDCRTIRPTGCAGTSTASSCFTCPPATHTHPITLLHFIAIAYALTTRTGSSGTDGLCI